MGGGRRYFLPSTAQDPEYGSNAKHGRLDGRDLIKVYDSTGLGLWCLTPLSTYFSYIVAVSFIGEGDRRTQRKPDITEVSI